MSKHALDQFGGWTGKRFEATGFFRVEKEDRWWLVTPEGNAFLSFGINHLHADLWNQDYNRTAWQQKLGEGYAISPKSYQFTINHVSYTDDTFVDVMVGEYEKLVALVPVIDATIDGVQE